MKSDSARYDEAIEVKPSNSRKSGTGSVVDPRGTKYPSTHEFASGEHENASKVDAGRMARRPTGKYRGSAHGFHTVKCTCSGHPCKCNTEDSKKALAAQSEGRKSTVNMC